MICDPFSEQESVDMEWEVARLQELILSKKGKDQQAIVYDDLEITHKNIEV